MEQVEPLRVLPARDAHESTGVAAVKHTAPLSVPVAHVYVAALLHVVPDSVEPAKAAHV